ncbi:MAG: amidohydrolase [Pseudomonadota bacterium]
MIPEQEAALAWIDANRQRLSEDHEALWDFHEPAWREYRSAAWYVDRLRAEGFEVEEGSGGMPTAFVARWGKGGPQVATYAEYDAVPGNSQEVVPYEKPRAGVHRWAAGHTDPHSALGLAGLAGLLAAKAAMEAHGLEGRLAFFGEPAEKMCGSKPIHASHGYYDDLDAMVAWHPTSLPALANTCTWDTHCGCYWSKVYSFECPEPESWQPADASGVANSHAIARPPGAIDAVCLMYTTTKYTKEAMLPHTGTWTLNEAILAAGQATSDNLTPRFAQIQYAWRCPTIEMAERIQAVLDRNAEHVAAMTHCTVRNGWVSKCRPGLRNHALAAQTYANFEAIGAPMWDETAKAFAREVQQNLGLQPMAEPFMDEIERLIRPEDGEALLRQSLPAWQQNYTSDDYVEYTWHCPTVRLFVGRPRLKAPEPGYRYPNWVHLALGGLGAAMDPMVQTAGKVIGTTLVELLARPETLAAAKAEFAQRTGGGMGGTDWVPPLLGKDYPAPVGYRWPEYVETVRGREWWIPATA